MYGTKYSRMDQVKFFKRRLSQILLGSFLITLSYMWIQAVKWWISSNVFYNIPYKFYKNETYKMTWNL